MTSELCRGRHRAGEVGWGARSCRGGNLSCDMATGLPHKADLIGRCSGYFFMKTAIIVILQSNCLHVASHHGLQWKRLTTCLGGDGTDTAAKDGTNTLLEEQAKVLKDGFLSFVKKSQSGC